MQTFRFHFKIIKVINYKNLFNFFLFIEALVDTFKKKVCGACEKFREIKSLPGEIISNVLVI